MSSSSSSSSSESESSDEEKKMSSNSSSESSSSSIEAKKKKVGRKPKTIQSESDASDNEEEEESTSKQRKRKQPATTSSARRVPVSKRTRNMSDGDHIDDEIFEDEEDKRRVMAMSEKEREQEIFNRMEQLETKKAREQIEKKLAAKNAASSSTKPTRSSKKRGSDSEGEDGGGSAASSPRRAKGSSDSEEDLDFHRPSEVAKKKKQKDAMATLRQQRLEKEKKNAKKAKASGALSLDAVFGKDEEDESDSDSSSSSSSSASSRSSSSKKSSASSKGSGDEESKPPAKEVELLQELVPARLSRFKCSKIVHAPFFKQVVVGCYIRIGVGPMGGGQSRYQIMEIVNVVETAKVYALEDTKTNKVREDSSAIAGCRGFVLRFGKKERVYRLEFISNSPFSQAEFEEWYAVNKMEGTLPRVDHIEKKKKDIDEAMTHRYTDTEIEQIVKEKSRFVQAPRNLAMIKGDLMKKKVRLFIIYSNFLITDNEGLNEEVAKCSARDSVREMERDLVS
ncbi:hypothetical protein WR25_24117 [Diploscapter pachys]|uniref:Plus3 domain-containing protein n=1 Tax=Diploscapter pachys TaxID=2018661 RepID=A0A2A2K1Q8_9BILA|nr:hypothetical protein WR25_24117 [Diploscapter pachys]